MYGHRWTATFGETAINAQGELTETAKTWASALRDVTGDQLAAGLRACLEREDTWPPALPEFKQLCDGKINKKVNEFGLDYVPEYYRTQNRITDRDRILSSDARERNRAQISERIAELKKSLK